ncbi:MAG: hypothetical protein HC811_04940 [Flammeovirgaceae bacterium]|nr:hypothetical protein [Flammeovirgaceae bacterium]
MQSKAKKTAIKSFWFMSIIALIGVVGYFWTGGYVKPSMHDAEGSINGTKGKTETAIADPKEDANSFIYDENFKVLLNTTEFKEFMKSEEFSRFVSNPKYLEVVQNPSFVKLMNNPSFVEMLKKQHFDKLEEAAQVK